MSRLQYDIIATYFQDIGDHSSLQLPISGSTNYLSLIWLVRVIFPKRSFHIMSIKFQLSLSVSDYKPFLLTFFMTPFRVLDSFMEFLYLSLERDSR